MWCPRCGAQVSVDTRFCEICGSRVSGDGEAPAQPASYGYGTVGRLVEPLPALVEPLKPLSADAPAQALSNAPAALPDAMAFPVAPVDGGRAASAVSPVAADQGNPEVFADQGNPAAFAMPSAPSGEPAQTTPGVSAAQAAQVSIAPFVLAIVALVTAVFWLAPVSIVLAVCALVMNAGQRKRGEVSAKQTPTTVMGVISLAISAITLVFLIIIGGAYFAAIQSGSHDAAGGAGGVVSVAPHTSEPSEGAVGTWAIKSMSYGAEVYGEDEIEYLNSLGMDVNLVLASNGTATLELFDESTSGTWREVVEGVVEIEFDGDTVEATVAGDILTMVDGTDELVFARVL